MKQKKRGKWGYFCKWF